MFMLIKASFQLACMAFLRPFKLNEELNLAGRYLATNVPIWQVWSGLSPDERRVAARAFLAVGLGAIVWPIVAALGAFWLGYPLQGTSIVLVALTSLLVGGIGLLFVGISFGVNMGGAVSLAGSLAAITCIEPALYFVETSWFGPVLGVPTFGLGSGLILGLILGLAAIATFTLRPAAWWFGGVCSAGGGLVLGALFSRVTGQGRFEIATGVTLAVFFALGFLAGYYLGYRRFPFYMVELVWQVGLTGLSFLAKKRTNSERLIRRLYGLSPVRGDELIWFKLWTLDRQLAWLALAGDRQFALETLVKIARSFRQGWAAEAALAAIMAHDLRNCKLIPDIAKAATYLSWFPRAIDLPSLALQRTVTLINEVSQDAEAATRVLDGPGWQLNLRRAQANLGALDETLARMDWRMAGRLRPIVRCWEKAVEQALKDVPRDAGPVLIENMYIFGTPIPPEREGVFVGREDLFAKIRENLDATHKPTLVLHGQRRTGKTSVLLQLPNRLPADQVPVYVDLQATAPVDGLNRFLYTLAREAVQQADDKRRMALPPVEMEDFDRRGTHAFYEWLEQTRRRLDGRLLLFALDEFEKIEEAIRQGRMVVAVLDVLRHLIQHHSSWLVLLFAGVRTLEEMGRDWHSYFISVKPLNVSYLDPEAARKLILLPTENHPIHYDRQAVETILRATHGQPFLVQAVCFELIQYLNDRKRRLAGPFGRVTAGDAHEAIRRAVCSARPYFQDLWVNSKDLERIVLAELAHNPREQARIDDLGEGLTSQAIHQSMEQLKRRELIGTSGLECWFQVPMLRQWIQDEQSLEAVRVASQPPPQADGKGGKKGGKIENPYIPYTPIRSDEEQMFVGREDLFAKIQGNLAAMRKPTLLLHGQHRTGKTSLLLQLPRRLPVTYVPVFVDLQARAPFGSLKHFLQTLTREAVCQAHEKRQITLPPAEWESFDSKGVDVFYEWLELIRQRLDRRILFFTLDEFEKIEEAIRGGQLEASVLNVLRYLIQHHSSWLVLLLAGVRTLEEVGRSWPSYFSGVKALHVSYLDPEAARDLILVPTKTCPLLYDEQVVETILSATGAQPFLVQAVCFELIQYLNSKRRRETGPSGRVTVLDAQEAVRRTLRSAWLYFSHLWVSPGAQERLILAELAHSRGEWVRVDDLGKGLKMEAVHRAIEHLRRCELVGRRGRDCYFHVPMMRQWIQDEVSLEAVRLASQSPPEAS
jgi:AAA+ ATPase superfamily predicted ATPase